MEKRLVTREKLPALAREVLNRALVGAGTRGRATLITLSGELGAGKTAFTQALARELGVTQAVGSPTYVLMKKYPLAAAPFTALVHIDAYRLEGAKEFAALKPEAFLRDPGALVVLEWPERVEGALPAPDLAFTFSAEGATEGERFVTIEKE